MYEKIQQKIGFSDYTTIRILLYAKSLRNGDSIFFFQ